MFTNFANVWTPVGVASKLKLKPLSMQLAGEMLVFFRDKAGYAAALIDRCPHRGVALSMGTVNGAGCLECPFHGWAFRGDGGCDHIPLSNVSEQNRQHYAATSLPVREIGGLLWVFTGHDPAGTEPELPLALHDPKWHTWVYESIWNTHWTRAMENMLDSVHVPFVHHQNFGAEMRARIRKDSVLRTEIEPRPWGAVIRDALDGEVSRRIVSWRRPNGMELQKPVPLGERRMHVYCVPLVGNRTRMILVNARNYRRGRLISMLLDRSNRRVVDEDRTIVESAQPPEVPPPGEELSVANDGPTLYFRRYYHRELRGSAATLVPVTRLDAPAATAVECEPSEIAHSDLLTPADASRSTSASTAGVSPRQRELGTGSEASA
jgi:phenylpropionate dioxygenase-like ring-hydroxylating dioxygenase large terminal subunit